MLLADVSAEPSADVRAVRLEAIQHCLNRMWPELPVVFHDVLAMQD
jgi:hypothetical protein